jgi:RNA polymerase sigma-70 factor (ECF subfamily)
MILLLLVLDSEADRALVSDLFASNYHRMKRAALAILHEPDAAEDAVQETFIRLIKSGPVFESEEHEKAWLIRTASNVCKTILGHWWRKRESIEQLPDLPTVEKTDTSDVLEAVLALPDRYKAAVYLYYYEGYTGAEIAGMLKKPQSTVRNHLREARIILKERLGDFDEER